MPSRPEEFHHRPLTEPCVRVSTLHSSSWILRTPPYGNAPCLKVNGSSWLPSWPQTPIHPRHPLGSTPITGASWLLSDDPPSQDAFLFCISLLAYSFSVHIILRLPKFLTRA